MNTPIHEYIFVGGGLVSAERTMSKCAEIGILMNDPEMNDMVKVANEP
jgi:hypothetical protein